MEKTDYKTPKVRVVALKITRQVCQNSIGLLLTDSDLRKDYDWVSSSDYDYDL